MNQKSTNIMNSLKAAGYSQAQLVKEREDEAFGNWSSTFKIDSLVIRFSNDRGQEFIEVGSDSDPQELYHVDDIVSGINPPPYTPGESIARLAPHIDQLCKDFDSTQLTKTKQKIDAAIRKRS